jgi:membrane protein implicated in regulation of membrane protease activity
MDWLNGLEAHWVWLTIGVLLAGFEMLVPGVYLIWLAIAAIVTGVLTGLLDLSLPMQVIDFVFLALISVFSARRFLRDSPIVSSDPLMNRRGARMIGETAVVVQAIEHGSGRVHVGDSEWIARGPDVPAGQRVRITGHDGASLIVEPLALLPDKGPPSAA